MVKVGDSVVHFDVNTNKFLTGMVAKVAGTVASVNFTRRKRTVQLTIDVDEFAMLDADFVENFPQYDDYNWYVECVVE